jgi:hypothetical protein
VRCGSRTLGGEVRLSNCNIEKRDALGGIPTNVDDGPIDEAGEVDNVW